MNEVTIPIKLGGLAQIKADLRDLKEQLANATDPTQIAALGEEAGKLADQIRSANEQVEIFSSGSKFEQLSDGFTSIGDSIMSLDFEEAAGKTEVFNEQLKSINPNELKAQFGNFKNMLVTLKGTFIQLGATILANPIFLIAAIIAAIVVVVVLVLKYFGVFDKVMKALMAPIEALIQGFKDMTDWLGLTAFAAEENAERTAEANKKVTESSKEREKIVLNGLQREINEAKAAGEDTTKLEKEITNTKIREANTRKKTAKDAYDAEKALKDKADAKKLEDLKKQIDAENETIKQGYSDKRVIELNAAKKTAEEDKKAADEKAAKQKAANDKYAAADKASLDQIAAARKIVTDSTKTAQQIEIDDLNAAYAKKIADAKKYKNDTKALTEAQAIEIKVINDKYKKIADDLENEQNKKREASLTELNNKIKALDNDQYLTKEELRKKEISQASIYYDSLMTAALAHKKSEQELTKIEIAEMNAINDIKMKYYNADVEANKAAEDKKTADKETARQKEIKAINDTLQTSTDALNTINSLASIGMDAKLRNVKKGSKEEEKILRAQFKQQKAMQLAMAAINGAQSILAIMTVPDFTLGIASGIRIAAAVAATAASIATISATQFNSPAAQPSADTGAGSATTAVAPSGPQLFGQANTGNNITAGGATNTNMTVTAVVSETEITATQHHVNNIQNNSKL